jgi:hypothetical protein
LVTKGFILRSGGAPGADTAFEEGVRNGAKEIYLPWRGFNGNSSLLFEPAVDDGAMELAATLHPAWGELSPAAKKLMARNSRQILGASLSQPVSFVVCYTPDGCESEAERNRKTGGTGQAIALADRHGIPIVNVARADAVNRIAALVKDITATVKE